MHPIIEIGIAVLQLALFRDRHSLHVICSSMISQPNLGAYYHKYNI